jgi:hypothetical protein
MAKKPKKKEAPKQEKIQVQRSNEGIVIIRLLSEILDEVRKIGRPK